MCSNDHGISMRCQRPSVNWNIITPSGFRQIAFQGLNMLMKVCKLWMWGNSVSLVVWKVEGLLQWEMWHKRTPFFFFFVWVSPETLPAGIIHYWGSLVSHVNFRIIRTKEGLTVQRGSTDLANEQGKGTKATVSASHLSDFPLTFKISPYCQTWSKSWLGKLRQIPRINSKAALGRKYGDWCQCLSANCCGNFTKMRLTALGKLNI